MQKRQQSFLEGAMILMASAVVVKVIGAFFKIPLAHSIGGGGMGYFMTAYGIFNPIYALSVAGLPVAVSRMTARAYGEGHPEEAQQVLAAALVSFIPLGLFFTGVMFSGAALFCQAVGNRDAYRAVLAIAPAVFFSCLSAVFRGHFEGSRQMTPTALSQLLEAIVKLFVGVLLAQLSVQNGGTPAQAAAAAISGVSIASAVGGLWITAAFLWSIRGGKWRVTAGFMRHLPGLLTCAVPVCLGALVVNLTSLVDLATIMNRLPPNSDKNFLYGCYTGLAMTIFNLVPAITASLGISALPLVSTLYVQGNRQRLRLTAMAVLRITAIAAAPASVGMCLLATPILTLLFGDTPQEVAVAAPLLAMLGVAALFVALCAPVISMLQAVGRPFAPVWLMLFGGALKLVVNYVLVGNPHISIGGAPIATLLCYSVIAVGGLRTLAKRLEMQISLSRLLAKPLLAAIGCGIAAKGSYLWLFQMTGKNWVLLPAVGIGAGIYLVFLGIIGGFNGEELNLLLKGSKFVNRLAKRH